ncbi:MAG: M48 family metalloprotease [Vicinamibacterales bacterium]
MKAVPAAFGDSPGTPEPSTPLRPEWDISHAPPMGAMVAAAFVAVPAGFMAGAGIADRSVPFVWVMAAGVTLLLITLTRRCARLGPGQGRLLAAMAVALAAVGFFMAVGGATWRMLLPPGMRSALAARVLLAVALLGGAAMPPAVVLAVVWSRPDGSTIFRSGPSPTLIASGLGLLAGFVTAVIMGLFIGLTARLPASFRVTLLLVLLAVLPTLLLPAWARAYLRVLSRWKRRPPQALRDGLDALVDRLGFAFDRVLCLDACVGGGRVCQVVSDGHVVTLVISERLPARMTPGQLVAVLAHEAAHVRLDHHRRKAIWGMAAALVAFATLFAINLAAGPYVRGLPSFAFTFAVFALVGLFRGLYATYVVRRHEEEADRFAVDMSGADDLLGALEALDGMGLSGAVMHNRWTTHGTREARVARIKGAGETRA